MAQGSETERTVSSWVQRTDRRSFLRGAGLAVAAGVAGSQIGPAPARAANAGSGGIPIKHVIVDCRRTARSITITASPPSPDASACRPSTRSPTGRAGW